jgi:hypothetical protein
MRGALSFLPCTDNSPTANVQQLAESFVISFTVAIFDTHATAIGFLESAQCATQQ